MGKRLSVQLLSPNGATTVYEDVKCAETNDPYIYFVVEKDGVINRYKTNLKFVILEEEIKEEMKKGS